MNNQNPPPLSHIRTTTQIFKRANTVVISTRHQFPIFLILSLVLFSVKIETQFINQFYISNPLIKSHFDEFQFQFNKPKTPPTTTGGNHLTRIFNSEINIENPPTKTQINATSITLDSFNSQTEFTSLTDISFTFTNTQEKVKNSSKIDDEWENNRNLITMLVLFETSGIWIIAILGIAVSHSCVHGVIFVIIVNHLLKKHKPIVTLLKDGAILGFHRLYPFAASVRSTTRMISTTILILFCCHFGGIKDIHTIFKIFVKVTCLPFYIWFPQVEEFEQEIYYIFSVSWWWLEILLSLVFTIFGCVAMVHQYISEMAVVERGFYLMSLNTNPIIGLKFLEEIVFGWLTRYVLARIFGQFFASFVQSFMEVYFLMVWTTYYFCIKSMDAHRKGQPFGKKVLKKLI